MPVIEFDQLSYAEIYTLSPDNKWVPLREFIAKAEERRDTLQEGIHKFCIIWDLDGVLADSDHRLHYIVVDRANPDWETFHAHTLKDSPIRSGCTLFWALDFFGVSNIICTARPESNRELTEQWLQEKCLKPAKLMMRKEGDHRPGCEVKRDMLHELWDEGYEVILAFDDHPEIVNMYRTEGVPCFAADPRHWDEQTVQAIAAKYKRAE